MVDHIDIIHGGAFIDCPTASLILDDYVFDYHVQVDGERTTDTGGQYSCKLISASTLLFPIPSSLHFPG